MVDGPLHDPAAAHLAARIGRADMPELGALRRGSRRDRELNLTSTGAQLEVCVGRRVHRVRRTVERSLALPHLRPVHDADPDRAPAAKDDDADLGLLGRDDEACPLADAGGREAHVAPPGGCGRDRDATALATDEERAHR